MPELPELEILCRRLDEKMRGAEVERVDLASISALKTYAPPLSALCGGAISSVHRRGKFCCWDLGEWVLAVHLARSGWVKWRDRFQQSETRPGRGPLALRVRLAGGSGIDVTEMATEKRLAIYVASRLEEIEPVATLGPEPIDPACTAEVLGERLRCERGDVKHALSHQSVVAGIGNAYSDEILHAAKLSPFKPAVRLSDEDVEAIHVAMVSVLGGAIERAAALGMDELKDDKRSSMRVHARTGEACPVCGDTVREVSFATRSLQYCPRCQTGGRVLADRRLSRLVK